ncbi:cytochrome P450 monooxygenase [Cordyceps fumosorosea ARSEF 2679]|uniref:Cytochrome P450 monooxygenase n=1 Tax=Cordyceps fumosorosea (strain ARSEF 2679) TaxID=1081104 RepID=A0A167LPV3_CORFA|nr:cytochrome P450 monooxygenase [Cordyceps fumosorosea ARSEF 2679]OAA53347.1 cytochrome P450 monooxygenase [Cordyceps fumosorosea ARSEF 2679]
MSLPVPAPHWSCHFSSFWILRARKNGSENASLRGAHRRLGNIVRVGPDTISVDGVDAMRTIYQGGFPKAPWYRIFDNYGVPCMFSTTESKAHSKRKRMISNVYSKSYILSSEAAKAQSHAIMFNRLLPLLNKEAADNHLRGTEVQSLFMATTMDMISAYIFGLEHGTNFLQDKTYRDHWLGLYLSRHHHHFWPQELPFMTALLKNIGIRLYPSFVDSANDELRAWNKLQCEKTAGSYFGERGDADLGKTPVVFRAMHEGIDKEETTEGEESILYETTIKQRDSSIASEILDQVLAGHETAGIVLTYASWHLSNAPGLQEQLRQELLPLFSLNSETLPETRKLDGLALLNAIVMETLRLHAPIPGPQPRRTPDQGCHMEGYFIPGGVRIASLAHTLHLNETVFSNPASWDPERWLRSGSDLDAMRRHFWAFGSGGRMCIGSNFALQEMKLVLAVIYANFTTAVVDDSGIEQTDGYSARPKADQLFLRFNKIFETAE